MTGVQTCALPISTEALGDPEDSFEKKMELAEWVSDFHVRNEVSGIVLCVDCHRAVHAADRITE